MHSYIEVFADTPGVPSNPDFPVGTIVRLNSDARTTFDPNDKYGQGTVTNVLFNPQAAEFSYRINWDGALDDTPFNNCWLELVDHPPTYRVGDQVLLTPGAVELLGDHGTGVVRGVARNHNNTRYMYRMAWDRLDDDRQFPAKWLQPASPLDRIVHHVEQSQPQPQPVIFHPRTRGDGQP